ncbi:hypothetical protein AB0I72_11410 [Nocardiopsis sp. NPDC049922]|uniref:hypothetical protein n=1 Tax=Nocardiopsis sp. NPDC049922 TaxID=3155157 RepID=UPI003406F423
MTTTMPSDIDPTALETFQELIEVTDPDLFAPVLPGETPTEYAARTAAAADILDSLLAEKAVNAPSLASRLDAHPDGLTAGVEAAAEAIGDRVTGYAEAVHRLVHGYEDVGEWAA